jgi:hypothetical protein
MDDKKPLSRTQVAWGVFVGVATIALLVNPKVESRSSKSPENLSAAPATTKKNDESNKADQNHTTEQSQCLKIHSELVALIESGDTLSMSRFCSKTLENFYYQGLNDGCMELRTGMSMLSVIYEKGEVPAPADFERAGRFIYRAGELLKNPKLKLESFNDF